MDRFVPCALAEAQICHCCFASTQTKRKRTGIFIALRIMLAQAQLETWVVDGSRSTLFPKRGFLKTGIF
jgi:hypothetical protein